MNNDNSKSQFFGNRNEIADWLDKYKINNYTINDDLSVDVNNEVEISRKNLEYIPIKFRKVTGNFWCNNNKLTSLSGSPKTVNGGFFCHDNELTTLTNSPEIVGSHFDCGYNQIISLIGAPKTVGGYFYCGHNKLLNLTGSPKTVGDNFSCGVNKLISLNEVICCNIKKGLYFNIDENNFQQKELIQILKKYYNSGYRRYELTNNQFYDTIKPQIEKDILQDKLNKLALYTKTKNTFL